MTVVDADKIDALAVSPDGDSVVMPISDHLDWSDEHDHLLRLQEKLNACIAFFESGQLAAHETVRGVAAGAPTTIRIAAKYPLPPSAEAFVRQASVVLEGVGLGLEVRVGTGSTWS